MKIVSLLAVAVAMLSGTTAFARANDWDKIVYKNEMSGKSPNKNHMRVYVRCGKHNKTWRDVRPGKTINCWGVRETHYLIIEENDNRKVYEWKLKDLCPTGYHDQHAYNFHGHYYEARIQEVRLEDGHSTSYVLHSGCKCGKTLERHGSGCGRFIYNGKVLK